MENYSLDEKLACRKSKIKKSNKVKNILPKSKNYPNPACTDGMKLNEKKKSISPRNLNFKNNQKIHFKYLIILFQIYLFLILLFPIVTQDTPGEGEGGETPGEGEGGETPGEGEGGEKEKEEKPQEKNQNQI